jgi:hypothetical protein
MTAATTSRQANVANRRPRDTGASGAAESEPSRSAVIPPAAWRLRTAVNDNKAPLLLRLRRLAFFVTAAAAFGWLFWAGVLR